MCEENNYDQLDEELDELSIDNNEVAEVVDIEDVLDEVNQTLVSYGCDPITEGDLIDILESPDSVTMDIDNNCGCVTCDGTCGCSEYIANDIITAEEPDDTIDPNENPFDVQEQEGEMDTTDPDEEHVTTTE